MHIRRYILVLALALVPIAQAQQQTQQQQQRSIQPIDRQVNPAIVALPQQMSPEAVTQTQPIPANILVSPPLPAVDPAQIKPAAPHQEVSAWTLEPTPSLVTAGFSTTSPPSLKKLPPSASTWTLAPAVNPGNRGFSTTLPQALSNLPPPASAWTLGPELNAAERDLAAASMSASGNLPLPASAGKLAQSAMYQNASTSMIPGSTMAAAGRTVLTSMNPGSAMAQVTPATLNGWTYSNPAANRASLSAIDGSNLGRLGPGTMGTALPHDLSDPRSLLQSYSRPQDAGLFDSGSSLTTTQMADSQILYGRHFERMDTLQGLRSPFASPLSAMGLGPRVSSAGYGSLRSRIATMRKSELPSELLHDPEVRRALRMASSHGQRDQKSSYCKLRSQCATLEGKSRNRSSSSISRTPQSSMRLRLESTLGN